VGQPLQYHLYNPPLPHVSNLHPQHLSAHAFFMSSEEREELQRKNEAVQSGAPPPELGGPNLPEELHVYHSLVSLEPSSVSGVGLVPQLIDPRMVPPTAPGTVNQLTGAMGEPSRVFGYRCHVYKALCTLDGKCYILRRLENFRLNHEAAISLVERWRRIRHPSIVSVREAFTTRAFGDSSIVFVYDYHPLSTTLYAEHMIPRPPQPDRRTGRLQTKPMQIPERTLWSYLCQLANVIRCIHHHGMAARCIEPSKVLRTSKNRVRLNCCSIFDVIAYDPNANAAARQTQQSEDLVNLGKLLVSLSCNSMAAVQNMNKSLEHIARSYSQEYRDMIMWLLSKSGDTPTQSPGAGNHSSRNQSKNAEELVKMLGKNGKFAEDFESSLNQNDLLESSLLKELENARLVRLLCKFGFINERPEWVQSDCFEQGSEKLTECVNRFDHDPRWSETGDRYIVKLFRDLVFHSVDEAGRPVVDLSHILTNLNKLDVGSEEKIMLTSRDEQSCLIVSYREVGPDHVITIQ
jgi:PAB-dependent poly(A)-specific ribonuclease subunit 3